LFKKSAIFLMGMCLSQELLGGKAYTLISKKWYFFEGGLNLSQELLGGKASILVELVVFSSFVTRE
jgi:hypothetical protein